MKRFYLFIDVCYSGPEMNNSSAITEQLYRRLTQFVQDGGLVLPGLALVGETHYGVVDKALPQEVPEGGEEDVG